MKPAGPGSKYKSSFGKKPNYLHGNGSLGGGVEHPENFTDQNQLVGCVIDPSRITVVAAGGAAGVYIDVIGSWGNSRSVTRKIEVRS